MHAVVAATSPRRLVPFAHLRAVATALAAAAVLATSMSSPARAVTPVPSVSLGLQATAMIGSTVSFTVTFDNTSPDETGYGPYVDLRLPRGADLDDGLTFSNATYLGVPVTATQLVASAGGCVTHPYAVTASGAALQVCGLVAGQAFVVLRLPFGSVTPSQPPMPLVVTTTLSNFADVDTALSVTASGGFQFGRTAVADPATDPTITGSTVTAQVTPKVLTLTKTYVGPESETATGPNFPRQYVVTADIAPGQAVTDLDLTDTLPGSLQYRLLDTSTPASSATATPSTSTPGGVLTRRFASVTGGAGAADASFTFSFHVPLRNSGSASVLDPSTGAAASATDTASASASWDPLDPRDNLRTVTAAPATHTLAQRSMAIQKSVAIAAGGDQAPLGVVNPGDTLEWTMVTQVSDFFAFDGVILYDRLGDGTRVDGGFTPRLAVAGAGFSLAAAAIDTANYTIGAVEPVTGVTPITFRISDELVTRGETGRLIGGCVNPAGGTVTPDCATFNDGPTTLTLTFRSVVQARYVDGITEVVEGDSLRNETSVTGHVLNTSTLVRTGSEPGDGSTAVATPGSSAAVSIPRGSLEKTIYAVNGSTTFASPVHIAPGTTVTFRLRQVFPTSRIDSFRLLDYLPLPVLAAGQVTGWDPTVSAAAPPAGTAKYGPDDTFHGLPNAPAPALSSDPVANSVVFTYGDYAAASPGIASVADLLFTVTVSSNPFADGLLLTNQARSESQNTPGDPHVIDSIIQFTLDQPVLAMTKGAVAAVGAAPAFNPAPRGPRPFTAPPSAACPAWSGGAITTANLTTTPINSNVSGLDAGDTVRFAIAMRNTGHADAYDVTVKDSLPAGFIVPAGGLNLCANRGDSSVLTVANVGGGTGLLDQGILLTGTGGTAAASAGVSATGVTNASGSNVIVVTFDLEVASATRPSAVLTNTASLTAYANAPSAPNHLGAPLTDTATTTMLPIAAAKAVTGTDEPSTADPNVAVGEIVTYRLTVTVPEGTTGPATITDSLPVGLAFVDCVGIASSSTDVTTTLASGFSAACNPPTNPTVTPSSGSGGGRTVAFTLGTLTNGNRDNATAETLTIDYRVVAVNDAANFRGVTRRNSAAFAWNDGASGRTVTARAGNVNVVEPILTVAKGVSPTSGDASDLLTYTIDVANPVNANGATAFEASLRDVIPAGLTYVPGSLETVSGTTPTTLGESSGTITATWTTYASGAATRLRYRATVNASIAPGAQITNTASAAWSSLPGSVGARSTYNTASAERTGVTTDPGLAANTYRASDPETFTADALGPAKAIVTTSEASTADSGVTVGEIVRYRLEIRIPEGSAPTLQVTDRLPDGLSYLAGTARVALVSSSGGLTSDTLTDPDVARAGDETTLVSITPTYVIPAGAVGGGGSDGADVTFNLGSTTNLENDGNSEVAVIEFNALVDNVAGNTAGATLTNDIQVLSGGVLKATSPVVDVTVREPSLTLGKSLTTVPADAGDALRYTLLLTNAGDSTAFEVELADTIDPDLILDAVVVSPMTGVTDLSSGRNLRFAITSIAPGDSVTVTIDATVVAGADAGRTIPNTATAAWTSLPGSGTSPNATGSVTPGASGTATGERDGSGGSVNTYATSGSVSVSLAAPSIAKLAISPASHAIGAQPVFTLKVTVPEGDANALVVTDSLPAGLELTGWQVVTTAAASSGNLAADYAGSLPVPAVTASPSGSAGGPLSLSFGDITNTPDGLAANDSFLVLVSTRVANIAANQAGATLTNTARLTFADPESGTTTVNAPAARTVTVIEPVVSVTKTALPTTPLFGGLVTYTLVVANDGPPSTADAFELDLSDVLPAGLTYLPSSLAHTAGTAPTTLAESGGTITATWTSIPLGGASTLTYQARVGNPGTVAIGDLLVNGVDATWTSLAGTPVGERTGVDGPLGAPNDYATADDAPVTVGGIDLGITKTDGVATATAGATLTYALAVRNTGNLTTTGITITETVPANTTFRTAGSSAGWSCANGAPAGTSCTLAIASIAGGVTANRTFVVRVDAPLPAGVTSIVNTATVVDDGTHGPDPDLDNNEATDTDAVPVADLSLTKTVDDPTPNVGDVVTFTVRVTNAGPGTAPGVAVSDSLPAGLAYAGSSASQGSYSSATGTWTIGSMAMGDTVRLAIDARVTASGTRTNVAEVSESGASDPDSTPGNGAPGEDDRASASLTPLIADLAVVKTVDQPLPDPGDDVVFTIRLSNLGPDTATGVELTDTLPTGLSYVSSVASQGGYDDATHLWTVGTVPVGPDVATLTITARVVTGGAIVNTATVSRSDVLDPDTGNNTDSASIDQLVDLVVGKSVDEPAQDVGRDVVFTVTVRNDGPSAATGVVIADPLPAGLTYVSHTGDGTYVPGSGAWTVGTLADGATAALDIRATVTGAAPVTNTASVADVDQPQSRTDNDTGDATVTPPQADVEVVKTVSDSRPALGETITWTVTVTNNGPDAAVGVVVADTLPAGLSLTTITASVGSYDAGTGSWTVGTLANGATETLDLVTQVTALGDRTNTATATATTYDPDPGNNGDDAFLTTKQADIGVGKSVDDPTPAVGRVVTFTITATNNGPDPARRVVLRDRLPAGVAYVSDDGAGAYDPATGDWAAGNLAVGDTATLHIDARVVASSITTNTASLHSLVEEDTDPDNNEASAAVDAPPAADLRLAKSAEPPIVANGQDVVFTLTLTNDGPDATTGVVVTDQLPPGLAYASDDGGGSYDPATGDWAVGDLGVGTSARLRITATVTQPGELANTAEVTASALPDPDSTPNNGDPVEDDQAQVLVNADNRADLSLAKSVSPTSVVIGGTVTYTLTLRNAGPDTATGVVVRDQLPAGVSHDGHSGGTYDPDTGAWTVGTIRVGEVRTLRIVARVDKRGTLVNRAEVAVSDAFDPDSVPGNGSRDEDDLGAAAIGGLRPTTPPTSASGSAVTGGSGGPDQGALAGILLAVGLLSLAVLPRRRPRRR